MKLAQRINDKQLELKLKNIPDKEEFYAVLDKIKALPGRDWDGELRSWLVPVSLYVIKKLKSWDFILPIDLEEKLKVKIKIKIPDYLPLFPYQKKGVQFVEKNNGRALIGDEMGTGKTIQAIAYMEIHPELETILIICPAGLKLNWQAEIKRWTKKESYIINGTKDESFYNQKIIIVNYDVIKDYIEKFKNMNIGLLIADEIHYTKSYKSLRTKAFRKIAKNIEKIIGLSGTPIENRPIEFFNILSILDKNTFPSWYHYVNRYCDPKSNGFGMDYKGFSNIEELHEIVTESIMIRRLKKDVLKDLPDKLISTIPLEIDNFAEYNYASNNFQAWLCEKGKNRSAVVALARIETLKQIAIEGKMKQIISWVDNFLETGKKLVIMCTHIKTVNDLMEKYKDIAVKFDGSCSAKLKNHAVESFQNNPEIKLFIGNIKAAGVGLTLTAASDLCFPELDWTPGAHDQASDRIHRIGQKECCNIYYFIGKNTIEEDIIELIDEKRKVITKVLDGKEVEESSILGNLLKKFNQK